MAIIQIGFAKFSGTSGENKPTTKIKAGSTFYETDTDVNFIYDGNVWKRFSGISPKDEPTKPADPTSANPTQSELQAVLDYADAISETLVATKIFI